MTIELTLSGKKYTIQADTSQYVPQSYRTNQDENSPNFGKESSLDLGYYTSLPNAINRLIREDLCSNEDEITLTAFILRYNALKEEITKQIPKL